MTGVPAGTQVWRVAGVTDMRRGFEGLDLGRSTMSEWDGGVHRLISGGFVVYRRHAPVAVNSLSWPGAHARRLQATRRALDPWAYASGVTLTLMQAGKPAQNGSIESFNGKVGDEWT